ncbi:unnamed protein product, partial [Symbiodinium sp. CCMP2456]
AWHLVAFWTRLHFLEQLQDCRRKRQKVEPSASEEPRKEDSKGPSKVSLKRRSKMEDPVWIRANWEVTKEPTAKGDWLVDG